MMSELIREVRVGDEENRVAVAPEYPAKDRVTQSHRVSHDRVEDRLDVGRRLADDPQDLARRRLLLEGLADLGVRLSERPVLLLKLREQPDVLDGDNGLVGEGLEQGDLVVGEGP